MSIIKHTDSYKFSHFPQYPQSVKYVSSYIEARYTKEFKQNNVVFFGLTPYIKDYLLTRVIDKRSIIIAKRFAELHGEPFNEDGWNYLYSNYASGRLPIEIEALPEGSVVKVGTPLLQIRNLDPKVPWLTSYLETSLLRAIWYPTTVATLSFNIKQMMRQYWNESVEESALGGLDFALHDFGARGVSSGESAALGGMGHLLSFNGSDTVEAVYAAEGYFPEHDYDPMGERKGLAWPTGYIQAYSVPAAEHSTITSWGKDHEDDAFKTLIRTFGGDGKLYSVVSDTYDIYDAVSRISSGELLDLVKRTGGRFVIRPDSGEPVVVLNKVLDILESNLGDEITRNEKGFKVLPPYFRIIQGDGVNYWSIEDILVSILSRGWSAENLVFGMGGALLQKVNRDTLGFAMKANAISEDGKTWTPISKKPSTDSLKASKAGRLDWNAQGFVTYYEDGLFLHQESFSKIRERVRK